MRARSLWWDTLTLTGAALASRGLGLIYRVLLSRFLGAEGLGLFQMVLPFYVVLVTMAVAGTPVAVSQMVAEGRTSVPQLIRAAIRIVLLISAPLIVAVIVWARPLAQILYHDARMIPLLWGLAPALLAVAFSAVLRGYFIGCQRIVFPAASQVAEQSARVLVLLGLLALVGHPALPHATLIAVLLIPLGEGVGLAVLGTAYFRHRPQDTANNTTRPGIWRAMLRLSVPVTVSRLSGSVIGLAEAALIPARLQAAGLSAAGAVQVFGQLTGIALPLIFFPTALTASLATNLVPRVADAWARNDRQRIEQLVSGSLKATALVAVPLTCVYLLVGVPLTDWLFYARVGPEIFWPLAVGGLFLSFDLTLAGILRGLGRTDLPLQNDTVANIVELILIGWLAARPGAGPLGVSLAIAVGFVTSAALNAAAVARVTQTRTQWGTVLAKPLVASSPLFLVLPQWAQLTGHLGWSPAAGIVSGLALAAGVYLVSLGISGHRFGRLI